MFIRVKCKSCQQPVLSTDKKCSHCSVDSPGKGKFSILEFAVGALMLWGAVSAKGWYDDWSAVKDKEEVIAVARKNAECRASLTCWGESHLIAAEAACTPEIERLAKFSSRWTTGLLDLKLSNYKWLDKESGLITYFGDKLEFQNGFGAYQRMNYACDYSSADKNAISVRVSPGRL